MILLEAAIRRLIYFGYKGMEMVSNNIRVNYRHGKYSAGPKAPKTRQENILRTITQSSVLWTVDARQDGSLRRTDSTIHMLQQKLRVNRTRNIFLFS